jgi:hypothetical protein
LYDDVLVVNKGIGVITPVTFTIISGAVPDGIVVSSALPAFLGLSFYGTPTTAGNYSFTVQAVPVFGATITKTFTINVLGITNANSLPDAPAGADYATTGATFTSSGGSGSYTYSVDPDLIPDWLTVNSNGTMSGIPDPTDSGITFTFDVTVTDSLGQECTQICSIEVTGACPDWSSLVWTAPVLVPGLNGGSCSASAVGDTVNIAAVAGLFSCSEVHGMTGTLLYSGDAWDGYIFFNVTNYIDDPHPTTSIDFFFEVRQGATLLASCTSQVNTNDFDIVDADGTRHFIGDLPNSFVIHLQGAATAGATITIQTGGTGWMFCCFNIAVQSEMTYDLKFSCSPTP